MTAIGVLTAVRTVLNTSKRLGMRLLKKSLHQQQTHLSPSTVDPEAMLAFI